MVESVQNYRVFLGTNRMELVCDLFCRGKRVRRNAFVRNARGYS